MTMAEPLIPLLAGDTAAVPGYLEQQAGLLRAAHRAATPTGPPPRATSGRRSTAGSRRPPAPSSEATSRG
jgi:hypothetical protein